MLRLRNVFVSLLILNGMVLIHEAGHGLAATAFGVGVPEVMIGVGPVLQIGPWPAQVRIGQLHCSLRLLLIGGAVRVTGVNKRDRPAEIETELRQFGFSPTEAAAFSRPERRLDRKPPLVRIVVSLAGVVANLLLAFALVFSASVAWFVIGIREAWQFRRHVLQMDPALPPYVECCGHRSSTDAAREKFGSPVWVLLSCLSAAWVAGSRWIRQYAVSPELFRYVNRLSGPVGITVAGAIMSSGSPRGAARFAYRMSRGLALVNLIPFPGLDGFGVVTGLISFVVPGFVDHPAYEAVVTCGSMLIALVLLRSFFFDLRRVASARQV